MRGSTSKSLFGILVVGVLIILGLSSDALGQGRGRRVSHMDKKCEKFVNCHDARDGRWDGRGPSRRVSWTDNAYRRHRRDRDWDRRDRDWDRRNRDWDRRGQDRDDLNHRRRHRDRDWDNDRNWRRRN